ncbi:MAG TPA: hypothetical protein PK156_45870 [Polyangium sp.]|nr:hypothetical protein [Polyangium sp.]
MPSFRGHIERFVANMNGFRPGARYCRSPRTYKVDGLTEAQIHEIIPDRPVAKKAKP